MSTRFGELSPIPRIRRVDSCLITSMDTPGQKHVSARLRNNCSGPSYRPIADWLCHRRDHRVLIRAGLDWAKVELGYTNSAMP